MFDEFFDNIEIFLQRFPALSSFKNSSSFTINLLLQVIFCRRMLPGYKTENNNSPQKSKLKNTKYSEESSHLAFWVYCYNPQCCTLVLMMVPLKLEQNDFAPCIHEWNLDWSWVTKIRQGVILIYSHKQGHLSCIDILSLKWDILKRKIKESNP